MISRQLIKYLCGQLNDANALQKSHHRNDHSQISFDSVSQFDGHQGIKTQVVDGLLYVEPGRWQAQHAGNLLAQVGLQYLPAFRGLKDDQFGP